MKNYIIFIFFIVFNIFVQSAEQSKVSIKIPEESKVPKNEYWISWCTVNQVSLYDNGGYDVFNTQWRSRELILLPGDYKKKGNIRASRVAIFLYTIMAKELIEDHKPQLEFYRTACKVTRLHRFSKPELYMEYQREHTGKKLAVTHNGVVALSKLAAQYKNPEGLLDQFGSKQSLLEPTLEDIKHRAAILRALDQKHSDTVEMK